MTNREAIEILGELKKCYLGGIVDAIDMAIEAVKAQEPATVEPKRIDIADETKAWLDKMDAVDALGNIANICMDWDGYRTADGLGGLINEIWAYSRYCADRLMKSQEPRLIELDEFENVLGRDVPLYFEQRDGISGWDIYSGLENGTMDIVTSAQWAEDQTWQREYYGKEWRCWTSRPDEKRRAETPWNM